LGAVALVTSRTGLAAGGGVASVAARADEVSSDIRTMATASAKETGACLREDALARVRGWTRLGCMATPTPK
jgi:hypothetical protein